MSDLNSTIKDVTDTVVAGIASKAKFYDIFERVLWTVLQVVSGEAIRSFVNTLLFRYNVMYGDHVMQLGVEWIVAFTLVITIAKNVIASHMGNGSASTVPTEYEPILPGTVVEVTPENTVVAASTQDPIIND